ncbi:uncharacterized protein LOC117231397 [Bombus vosnesenskii]|uniref:Uncharacterized protein LOC117231397 n=1 Tax=Bombus vosnesenskii TaxID=207650 RepID=A0A6J3JZU5_9HYME|nr:uncharacterized protein LOC117231397 [Bombus vosnesenskii]
MATPTPYLDAIQSIPGDTSGEKLKWIADFVKQQLSVSDNLEDVVEYEKIPKPLVPLVQIQAAIILNKKDPKNQSTYEAIAEALKSEDKLIVNKALKAKNFFNGTNESITNTEYFFENLFPYVSLNTRTRIIKALALHLAPRNSSLAEKFFLSIDSFYGLEHALPLLLACSETFVYNIILEKRMVLRRNMVKLFFRKNPDFVVRYLRLSKPTNYPCARRVPSVNIHDFTDCLVGLVKTRIESFAELCEMHEEDPPKILLSNKSVEAFLKNGKEYLERNAKLYITMLPLKSIDDNYMEIIFPKLLPDNVKDFNTDNMLNYLKYYRQDRKTELFLRTYQQVYNSCILDDSKKVTANLLEILHPRDRINQAKIKLRAEIEDYKKSKSTVTWECFLAIEDSLTLFRNEICKTSEMEHRMRLACRMIHSCKINNDDLALIKVLTYLKDRHYNEQPWFLYEVFKTLLKLYDLPQMGEDYWTILIDMIVRAYVKKELFLNNVGVKMVEAAIHYKINQNQPFRELIDMLVDLRTTRCRGHWNILQKYHNYERMCLEDCLNIVSQKYNSDQTPWKQGRAEILSNLCSSIYYYNQVHVNKASRVERMAVKNYPWLLKAIEEILSTPKQSDIYAVLDFQDMFMKYETDLYERFWPRTKKIELSEALKLLKRNPQEILDHWKEYLNACKDNWKERHTKLFIKAIRWYKEIPIKFAEQCLQDLTEKKEEICLDILSILVYGETFSNIIEPLIPTNKTLNIHQTGARISYHFIRHLVYGIKLANPPVPLTMLNRLCQGDYLPLALTALVNVCRRTNVMDVIPFARMLSNQKSTVRKHGMKLMRIVASRSHLLNFFQTQWKIEKNQSIREVIFFIIAQLFQKEPEIPTWLLFSQMISSLTLRDEKVCPVLLTMIKSLPDHYVVDFIKQTLNMIDTLERLGLHSDKVAQYTSTMLSFIDVGICNLLAENFIKFLIQRYLFHQNLSISNSLNEFVVRVVLLPEGKKFDGRLKIFSSLLGEAITRSYSLPNAKNAHLLSTNLSLRRFVDTVMHTVSCSENKIRLVDEILSMFISTLHPLMDPTSYLQLTFSRAQLTSSTPVQYGLNVGQTLCDLIKIFSPHFVFFMTDILRNMPVSNPFECYNKIEIDLGIIEGLIETNSVPSMLMAVQLMYSININEYQESNEVTSIEDIDTCNEYQGSKEYQETTIRRDGILIKLMQSKLPAVRAMICEIINKTNLNNFKIDLSNSV